MKKLFVASLLVCLLFSCTEGGLINTTPTPTVPIPAPFTALTGIFGGQGVGASVNIGDEIILFFSSNGKEYAWFEDTELKFTRKVKANDSHFAGLLFNDVGAVIDFEEEQFFFFNDSGNEYQEASINPDNVAGNSADLTLFNFAPTTLDVDQWGQPNACPFDEVGAAFGFSKEPLGCDVVGDDDDFLWLVNEDGDQLARYVKETKSFDPVYDLAQWRSENVCGGSPLIFPLSSIGASCIYEPEMEDLRELYFSEDGKSFAFLNTTKGEYSQVYSLK